MVVRFNGVVVVVGGVGDVVVGVSAWIWMFCVCVVDAVYDWFFFDT
jgi:hypothetical protein